MEKKSYPNEVEKLLKAIDLSIEAYKKYPPKDWTPDIVKTVTAHLEDHKNRILNAEEKFKILKSLKYDIDAVFTFFQEGAGEAVAYFWKRIEEEGLDYERVNKLEKILKRGKIKGIVEYDYVIDIILVAEQKQWITVEELKKLNQMIGEYESKRKRK
ncbi:hypothetical protein [Fluviicola sp.]|uniref:hypothetical protein n=1 Tax=Fluviicola sp. TaxID=1917219 RepID=UPI00262DD9BE|nr:hypothetical protein [Fluviicola sp.]